MTLHHGPRNGSFRRSSMVPITLAGMAAFALAAVGSVSGASASATRPKLANPAAVTQGVATSGDFAGYRATPYGGLTSARVTFTIPAVACTTRDSSDGALLADGLVAGNSRSGDDAYATAQAWCINGSGPSYTFELGTPAEMFTEPGANPGDTVVISVFQTGTFTWVEIADQTSGVYWMATDRTDLGLDHVDLGIQSKAGADERVPAFAKMKMHDATVNDESLASVSPTQVDNVWPNAWVVVKAGKLKTNASVSRFSLVSVPAS